MQDRIESVETLWADFAAPIRTAEDYINSLRGRRMNVFFMGERVLEPVDHPVIRPSINAMAETYRLATEQPDLATVHSGISNCRINRFLHVPVNPGELVAKHEMQRELGRRTGTDGGCQRDAGHHRGNHPHVGQRGEESGERLDADVAQRGEALDGDQRAAGQRHEPDDRGGAADDGHRAGAHADLGDQPQNFGRVAAQRPADLADADPGERGQVSGLVQSAGCGATVAVEIGGRAWVAGA